jgi:hypothetical protein
VHEKVTFVWLNSRVLELDEKEMHQVWGDKSASLANSWVTFLETQAKEAQ